MKIFLIALTAGALTILSSCAPEPFDAARVKGSQLLQKNEFQAAAAEYEKSLELKPDQDVKVWERAAYANMKAGKFDRAAELLEKTVARRPDAAAKLETLRNIAGMYKQEAGDLESAEKYFQKALALDPKDEQSLGWLAEISAQRGGARQQNADPQPEHLQVALERYDAVVAVNPNKPDTYINKRIVLMKYMDYLTKLKVSLLADAEKQKKDKEAFEDFQQQAIDTQTRIDELKAMFDEATKKLGEANKAAKAAK